MLVFQTVQGGVVRQLVTRRDEVVALLTPPRSPQGEHHGHSLQALSFLIHTTATNTFIWYQKFERKW